MTALQQPLQGSPRAVIYRAYHPTTKQPGFSGFVEHRVCVYLHWHPTYLAACREVRKVRRRM